MPFGNETKLNRKQGQRLVDLFNRKKKPIYIDEHPINRVSFADMDYSKYSKQIDELKDIASDVKSDKRIMKFIYKLRKKYKN